MASAMATQLVNTFAPFGSPEANAPHSIHSNVRNPDAAQVVESTLDPLIDLNFNYTATQRNTSFDNTSHLLESTSVTASSIIYVERNRCY
jgi:hypothetical protein